MARSAEAHGVEIRLNADVRQILTTNTAGRTGCLLADGDRIYGRTPCYRTPTPSAPSCRLWTPTMCPDALLTDIRRAKTNTAFLKFHAALNELPDFSAYLGQGLRPQGAGIYSHLPVGRILRAELG